ncbi:hypothetical protein EYF80_035150 [Liparis tanakae]|uniref:Uncharacterized protein n=1 Tax=Liparis tanakae TaxID=230148 RepID=A0A4Z2GM26_9TELE|nr:hypothetical protein EYF80_035150 [Liparis tanakae]
MLFHDWCFCKAVRVHAAQHAAQHAARPEQRGLQRGREKGAIRGVRREAFLPDSSCFMERSAALLNLHIELS